MKEELIKYLEDEPRARERKNKDNACVNLILRRYPHMKEYKKELIAIVGEYNSMDRMWRKVLEEREDLRGSDYDQKQMLEEKAMLKLDYVPHGDPNQNDIDWFNKLPNHANK